MAAPGDAEIEIYKRTDGKWAWRLQAGNSQVIATDGGQGYENMKDAQGMVMAIVTGMFADAGVTVIS